MNEVNEIVDNLLSEFKRGTIVLCVMSQLFKPTYGYSLVQTLEEKGNSIDASTLYPLMRRLEGQELLNSEWETSGNKPRKYYVLSEKGIKVYQMLCKEWNFMIKNINSLLNGGNNNG